MEDENKDNPLESDVRIETWIKVHNNEPKLEPVELCSLLVRNVPTSVRDRLWVIRIERGWNSWSEMIEDVVKQWGGDE
jgi:hypothetical protein